jgi:UDPglucose 6-dehydrogenase
VAQAVEAVNKAQKSTVSARLKSHYGPTGVRGKTFAVWGLAFKPKTDDTREAPALTVCDEILALGGSIRAYDPEAVESFKERFGEPNGMAYVSNNYAALEGADALIICTEWSEFRRPNFARMRDLLRAPVIFDGRNLFSRKEMAAVGFTYYSVGRPAVGV